MKYTKLKHHEFIDAVITCFGLGYAPFFPGTVASAATAVVYYFLFRDIGLLPNLVVLIMITVVGTVCIKLSGHEKEDPRFIVIDEVCGVWISVMLFNDPVCIIIGFILFRVFDILKPFPISYFDQKMKNSFGVMFDDIAAGIIVAAIIQALVSFGYMVCRF